jgi:hypothetical protein
MRGSVEIGGPGGSSVTNRGPGGSSPAERSEADQTAAFPWPKDAAEGSGLRVKNE